jgi:hypothetical protein
MMQNFTMEQNLMKLHQIIIHYHPLSLFFSIFIEYHHILLITGKHQNILLNLPKITLKFC